MIERFVILALLAVTNTAGGIDSSSMLQVHDGGLSGVREAHQGALSGSIRKVPDGPAPFVEDVYTQADSKRQRHAQRDDSTLWTSTFAGQEALEKEWMANFSGESPGVMRMLSSPNAKGKKSNGTNPRVTVWIPAQARSGSTLLMDFLTVPVTFGPDDHVGSMDGKFVLFEPCHNGDTGAWGAWNNKNMEERHNICGRIIEDIATCDFSDIGRLGGWTRPQSQGLPNPYSKQASHEACLRADEVVFKTIWKPPSWEWVRARLEHVPSLRIVQNVRDPRSVLASQKKLFNTRPTLEGICEYYSSLVGRSHERFFLVKFENMIRWPGATMRNIYNFLGLEYGSRQEDWVWDRFGNSTSRTANCTRGGHMANNNFDTCPRDVDEVINKWQDTLTEKDLRGWTSRACQDVAREWNYLPPKPKRTHG